MCFRRSADAVLMAHMRIVAHHLDKELRYSQCREYNLSEGILCALTVRYGNAHKRFTRFTVGK